MIRKRERRCSLPSTRVPKLDEHGVFCASEVLAKHDENYMPPEAAKALEDAHKAGVAKKQAEQAQAAKS